MNTKIIKILTLSLNGPIYCDIFEPAEWIRYIAIYFNLPSDCDIWPADKPPIYLQKSFISIVNPPKKWQNS